MFIPCLVRLLRAYILQVIINLNLFESETPVNSSRERLLTRVFLVLIIVASIAVGFYAFLAVSNQVVLVAHPSLDTYRQLQGEHDSTLTCPCSQLSMPYETFLNITFILHQICSSDLVSPDWLDYLLLFDPTLVPPWTETDYSRDFRTIGASYFQFLATFCLLTRTSLDDAQHAFTTGQFINDRVLAPFLFKQRTQAVIDSFTSDIENEFARTFDWIDVLFRSSFFLAGTGVNFYATVSTDNQVDIGYPVFREAFAVTHDATSFSGVCSCVTGVIVCRLLPLIYTNGSSTSDFQQVLYELRITCVLSAGFIVSGTLWWFNDSYLENIRETYSLAIGSQASGRARALDSSVPSQFGDIELGELLRKMLLERWISDGADFAKFYDRCAPLACSYTVTKRRDIAIALLLLISICGGLNRGLRIIVPFVGRLAFFSVERWNNRTASISVRCERLPQLAYRSLVDLNLFKTASTDDRICRQQKIYTRVYLIVFLGCLSVLLFYNAVVERSVSQTHWSPSIAEFEHLHDLYQDGLSCPCTKVSIPYGDFVTELRVDAYHQVCFDKAVEVLLLDRNDSVFFRVWMIHGVYFSVSSG